MCGIIGIIEQTLVADALIAGLRQLEYRGYDSAGIATIQGDGSIDRRRTKGKLAALARLLEDDPLEGRTGIGHTRWATHGVPNVDNAHPHSDGQVAVVHNGIIENFDELRTGLEAEGLVFESDTDTEAVVHLISKHFRATGDPEAALAKALPQLHGAFALAVLFKGYGGLMAGARRGSPLAVGYGATGMYLGSDALALAHLTNRISYLEEGDWVILTQDQAKIYTKTGQLANREVKLSKYTGAIVGKGDYRHFMEKEIHEQPSVVGDTLHAHLNPQSQTVYLPDLPFDFAKLHRLVITACGTAFYAGLVAKYWFEQMARLPVEIDVASELRYRQPPLGSHDGGLVLTQSGETADTLAALRYMQSEGVPVLAIVNVAESTIAREADALLQTGAGPEIGVASTKAFTTQLAVLACLAIKGAEARGQLDVEQAARLVRTLREVPAKMQEILHKEAEISIFARSIAPARDVLFLGRGSQFPIALEGALKLKEVSYIHAEGYAAGEMKHGPIALIDAAVPVIVCAPPGPLFEKTLGNMQEVVARGGQVFLFSDATGFARTGELVQAKFDVGPADDFIAPLTYALPVQMLAYHTAVLKGTDVDQPRNLAKSVTVE